MNRKKNAYTQSSLIHGFCLILVLYCQEMKYLFLLEFFFIFICITATDSHTQGGDGLRDEVVATPFSESDEVCVSKTEQSLCWKNHLNNWSVSQWLVSFSMVLACAVQADCLSVNTSVPCELCCFKSLARGFISQTDISTEQETDDDFFFSFCFVLMGHMALPQQGVFNLMLEFFFMMVCDFAMCMFVRLKKIGGSNVLAMFFVFFPAKLGDLMTHLPKHPLSEYLIRPLHFASVCLM